MGIYSAVSQIYFTHEGNNFLKSVSTRFGNEKANPEYHILIMRLDYAQITLSKLIYA